MKRATRVISILVSVLLLLAIPIYAEEGSTYSSIFFGSYDSEIYNTSGRNIEIWFDVVGNGEMDEIGASCIELERSSNGTSWTVVQTFLPEDYPQMICRNTGINYDCVSCKGSYGYYYRAHVTCYAKNSRGEGYMNDYSETIYLSLF